MSSNNHDLINKLRAENPKFANLHNRMNDLEHKIKNLDKSKTTKDLETLTQEKQQLQEEINLMLQKHS